MPEVIAALARHGKYHQPADVPSAHLPHGLTDEGRRAAAEMADALYDLARARGWAVDPVVECSTLRRAYETAEVAAARLSERCGHAFELSQFDALCERCLGAAANLTVQQIETIIAEDPRHDPLPPGWKASADLRLPFVGAENLAEAGERVAGHLEARMAALQDSVSVDTVRLVVGHGAAFRHAAAALGVLSPEEIPGLSMYHCKPVYLARRGQRRFARVEGAFKVRPAAEARD